MANEPPKGTLTTANMLRRSNAALSRRLRAMRVDHGVSASKLSVLGLLERASGPLTASELADRDGLQPQSLTRIIADLEESGLIRRRQAENDRRQVLIEITKKGHDLLAVDARRQNSWLANAMVTMLTPTEQRMLRIAAELLDRLTGNDPRGRQTGPHIGGSPDDPKEDA
jgi:DNA-binding MarR family transcriptional regulator